MCSSKRDNKEGGGEEVEDGTGSVAGGRRFELQRSAPAHVQGKFWNQEPSAAGVGAQPLHLRRQNNSKDAQKGVFDFTLIGLNPKEERRD